MKFKVIGTIKLGTGIRPFAKEVEAKNESHAKHVAASIFGSTNGVKRPQIVITGVSKV
jgi:ribosomal protein L20A (L18A)